MVYPKMSSVGLRSNIADDWPENRRNRRQRQFSRSISIGANLPRDPQPRPGIPGTGRDRPPNRRQQSDNRTTEHHCPEIIHDRLPVTGVPPPVTLPTYRPACWGRFIPWAGRSKCRQESRRTRPTHRLCYPSRRPAFHTWDRTARHHDRRTFRLPLPGIQPIVLR